MANINYDFEVLFSCLVFDHNGKVSLNSLCSSLSIIKCTSLITIITPYNNFQNINKFLENKSIKYRIIEDFSEGYYKALNLAIKNLKGHKILIFNSGDFFLPTSFSEFEKAIKSDFDIYSFSTIEVNSFGNISSFFMATFWPRLVSLVRMPSAHMGLLIKKEIYFKYKFDETLGHGADYYWLINVIYSKINYSYKASCSALGVFYGGGFSTKKGLIGGIIYQQKLSNKFIAKKLNPIFSIIFSPFIFVFRLIFVCIRIIKRLANKFLI